MQCEECDAPSPALAHSLAARRNGPVLGEWAQLQLRARALLARPSSSSMAHEEEVPSVLQLQERLDELLALRSGQTARTSARRAPVGSAASGRSILSGVWSCCEQANPGCAGCLCGPHCFDFACCANCGQWIAVQEWQTTRQAPKIEPGVSRVPPPCV